MENKIDCVMLIDDHHPTNVLHNLIIENCSCTNKIVTFDNGQDALEYLYQPFGITHPKPNIIFLDINMPGMSGWDFVDAYKQLPKYVKLDTLLFMLSTSSHPEDIKRAEMETVIKDYIYKPLTEEVMKHLVKKNITKLKKTGSLFSKN